MTIKVGDLLPFFPPFNTSYPKAEIAAVVTAVNGDGTVDLEAQDGHATPYAHVELIDAGAHHGGSGRFALRPSSAAIEETATEEKPDTEKPSRSRAHK